MSDHNLSRRRFLKIAGIGVAGSVVACSGLSFLANQSLDQLPAVETPALSFGQDSQNGPRLLMVYATQAGSTLEIADKLAEELAGRGFQVTLQPASANPSPQGFSHVILGSPVHYGAWLPEAVEYIKANQEALAETRLAVFSVHITNLEEDEQSLAARLAYLDGVRPYLQAEEEIFFAGRFGRRGAALLLPGLIAWLMPELDKRNWTRIQAWGQAIFA